MNGFPTIKDIKRVDTIDYNIFAKNIKVARFIKQLTAEQLSKLAGLRQVKRVSDIEDGRGKPSLEEVYAICKALEQPIDFMLDKQARIKIEY